MSGRSLEKRSVGVGRASDASRAGFFAGGAGGAGVKQLLGVGGTDDGIRALERTLDRVHETGDELSVAVFENPESESTPDEVEADVRDRLETAGVAATVYRLEGHAGSELIELAEREGFDRIVLGGGERSPMGKVQVGSVAQFVVVNAPLSVTLVR